jgi:Zn-dependent protease with chaperone function
MSRPMLVAAVALAAYAALNLLASLAVALAWRRGALTFPAAPAARAARLATLRAVPALGAAVVTAVLVVPAFVLFEPVTAAEPVGPALVALALVAVAQWAASAWLAVATTLRTRTVARHWLRASEPLHVHPPAGVPAYTIDSPAPVVALVGVFAPTLVAARSVVSTCSTDELVRIVAHERGHVQAHDNLKRWLMNCAPDALRWTPVHHDLVAAWHEAAEDAADDVATGGDAAARTDLAALLVKMARLTSPPCWPAATVSPFVERDGLERRVRRLLSSAEAAGARSSAVGPAAAAAIGVMVAAAADPVVLARVYDVIEALVVFAR